ncbi:hypothetical protein HRG_006067 [Hirsutella rhossiliensis]|uniref:Uncharacterized protein n=1 Tax=Hirsutella rhossiliensis TaxID=111463 RepID=A0A9P8MYA8_9HYPO|nr:uncharacterized protein HRG_06067 [Hirsutella rhossiliensis]KAH0963557.1 hypothetical protein HRG_06067 [Hirsutella rhossiliensis]
MAFSSPAGIIYQALIQSNCQTFLGGDIDVDVVSQLDAVGTRWQVHVLRTDDAGKRTAVLSGAAPTLHEAFEELHRKSAQAVDRYVTANGFDARGTPGRRRGRKRCPGRRSGLRDVSTEGSASEKSLASSMSTLTASSASASGSDSSSSAGEEEEGEEVIEAPKKSSGRKQDKVKARSKKLPGFDLAVEHGAAHRPWNTGLPPPPVRANKAGPQPPPGPLGVRPPPGWPTGRFPGTGNMGDTGRGANNTKIPGHLPPPPPLLKGPGARPVTHHLMPMTMTPPMSPPVHMSIILTVDWAGHGQATFADECDLSVTAVQRKVRTLLARRAGEFGNASPRHFPAGARPGGCEVAVRRVRVDGQVFVLAGADDCLAMVVASVGPAPRVVHVFVDVRGDEHDVVYCDD